MKVLRLSLALLSLAATLTATLTAEGELRTIGPAQPISIDRLGIAGTNPVPASWTVVGNGETFLLLWRDDRDVWPGPRSIGTLPKPVVRTWWNGSAYVVQVRDGFLRIGANGTGGGPVGLIAAPVMNETAGLSTICDPAGCTAATVTRLDDGRYRAMIVRLDDDGTNFTVSKTPVVNFVYPDGAGPVRPAIAGTGGHPILIHSVLRQDPPYLDVQRLMVTPVGTPRSRAAGH